MALCLFANSYFKTLAAARLDAVLMYPLNQGAALILSSAMASLLFREKLTAKAIAGIVLAFAGLVIINLL
jgi:multidrug transporter EmrE-like cation transporter